MTAPARVLVCVTGGVAAYKACELVRELQRRGHEVRVLMTAGALEFVGEVTFRALTGQNVATDNFHDPDGPIPHISLAKWADAVVVAPATANALAKLACGIADDLLSTTMLAVTAPVLLAPAMNANMWRSAATRSNVRTLADRGFSFAGPGRGHLACGDSDDGRMAEPAQIADALEALLDRCGLLSGERVLVSAGPTFEPIDPVRFIGNRSSGKMGAALASAARDLGACVRLVLGPCAVEPPAGVEVARVETADEMLEACLDGFERSTMAVLAAAVSDYRPARASDHKLKKSEDPIESIELVETRDILAELAARKGDRVVVGFAAETGDLLRRAREKLARKGCDAIVANDVSEAGAGFGSDSNHAWWVVPTREEELPPMPKSELAREILMRAAALRGASALR